MVTPKMETRIENTIPHPKELILKPSTILSMNISMHVLRMRCAMPRVSIVSGVIINARTGFTLTLIKARITATATAGRKPSIETFGIIHASKDKTNAETTNL
jgi:hypothetical protein